MDSDRVICNLELQIRWIEEIECHRFPGWLNVTNAMRDAIDLLKEKNKNEKFNEFLYIRSIVKMKKIPTLFEREYENHKVTGIKPILTSPDLQWVLDGEGTATEKIDGTCCSIINGEFYKRYDAKRGKKPPEYAIPCSDEPDPVTGHWPHWIPVTEDDPGSRWHIVAKQNAEKYNAGPLEDGTYEAVGPHFQGNPHHLEKDTLIRHGITELDVPRTFEGLRDYLEQHEIEGIVFWKDGEPQCKIKRSDFGFKWPV